MTTVIVSSSKSNHGNTRRVADAIADVLGARVITPEQAAADVLLAAQRIGFGSGIYRFGFDPRLTQCVRSLPDMAGREAFIFATSGTKEPPFRRYTRTLRRTLTDRGFEVTGTFHCRGFDTWGPFRLVGGVNKGHPDEQDLAAAREFAAGLKA